MSAVTAAVLAEARQACFDTNTRQAQAYFDTIRKAPAPIVVAHLLGVSARYLRLALRYAAGRTR